ncbi:importin-4-like [Corticium candelabrum]|uniref:importin-4-like n=1 Tax=Corticium candelabrum TaxID=121492 RepID=UPI002E27076E|nr:importin-4-like [Corticium candelabrum]
METNLETILAKLLVPDNSVIQAATTELKQAVKNPAIVDGLVTVLTQSEDSKIRQLSAVLLRQRLMKMWPHMASPQKTSLKQLFLQLLVLEKEHIVRNSTVQIVSVIASYELAESGWNELFMFLNEHCKSQDIKQREFGFFLLSAVTDTSGEQLKSNFQSLFRLFGDALCDRDSRLVPYYTIKSLTHLVEHTSDEEIKLFRSLIPHVLQVITLFLQEDEDQAVEAMEIFDELVECDVSIIVPHLKDVLEFCLEVAVSTSFSNVTRVKALSFVSWLTRLKKKAVQKQKILPKLLNVIFSIMASSPEAEEGEDETGEDAETSLPSSFASQVLDTLALYLPPEVLFPPLMELVEPASRSCNPYEHKAALVALAVLAEGCRDFIRHRYLKVFLQGICEALSNQERVVRNAAMFALGQFSVYMQPDISNYCADILPLLFENLSKSTAAASEDQLGLTKTYYALEMFCENLGDKLLPYLPELMTRLFAVLEFSTHIHERELAISAIGATSNAVGEGMQPYFPRVIEYLRVYLTNPASKELLLLQTQALDTLGAVARTVGRVVFLPLAEECIQLGLSLIGQVKDPDLRRCVYGLFASVSTVSEEPITPHLATIVKLMLDSLRSNEGVVTHYADSGGLSFKLDDDDDDDEDDSEEDVVGHSVENAYVEEKEDTCNALGEIAASVGSLFVPFLKEVYTEVFELIEYPTSNVRKAAVTNVSRLCCSFHKCLVTSGATDLSDLQQLVEPSVVALMDKVRQDKDRGVVMASLEAMTDLLKEVKGTVIHGDGSLDAIVMGARHVFELKTACQDTGSDEESEDELLTEDNQAEYDGVVIELAGELLPALASALGGEAFAPYFAGFLPLLLARNKKSSSVAERSFAIGTISELIQSVGTAVVPFVRHLLPIFVNSINDTDDEVRSNAVFGMGLLAAYGGKEIVRH